MTKSVYDKLDELERDTADYKHATVQELADLKSELYDVDDDLEEIEGRLESVNVDDLTFAEVKEFFGKDIPAIREMVVKLRERLY